MKKTVVFMALLGLSCTLFSQTQLQKGTFFIAGSFSHFSTNSDSDSPFDFGSSTNNSKNRNSFFGTSVGYLLSPRFALGLSLRSSSLFNSFTFISTFGTEPPEEQYIEQSRALLEYGIFTRYFAPFNERTGFFLNSGFAFGSGTITEENTFSGVNDPLFKSTSDINSFSINISPGLYILLNKRIGLDLSIGGIIYSNENQDSGENNFTTTTDTNTLSITASSNISIGLQIFFNN